VIDQADAVVIGSGAFGASVGYHLAALGWHPAIIDRYAIGSQTSPRAAGQTQQIRYDRVTSRMAIRSVEKLLGFEAETGLPLAYHQSGAIKIARTPEYAEQVRDEVLRGQREGIDIELIDRIEASRKAPYVNPSRALAIWWTGSDLYLEPGDLPVAYARAAEARGATLLGETRATSITTKDGAVTAVETDRGAIRTPIVVDAAGAWAAEIAAMAGVWLPVTPVRHQLYVTEPIPAITADMPIARVVDAHVYVRPERGGLMFGGYEPDPIAVDPSTLPNGIADLPLDVTPLRRLTEDVLDEYPDLRTAAIAELRGGLPTMTVDGHHIFDQASGVQGFWVMSGCVVGGLSISPAAGEALAHWIVTGEEPFDLSWFRLSRFGSELEDPDELRRQCLRRYSHHYLTPERSS
jgi:glycine/D-amino acid oxidase-like deaminating enzyme